VDYASGREIEEMGFHVVRRYALAQTALLSSAEIPIQGGLAVQGSTRRHPLYPNVRRSPYFPETERAGATEYMVYNHMYMPIDYGRDPAIEYRALLEGVSLWDVGAERQTELRGPDALRLADFICARDLSMLDVGRCRYTPICDDDGTIMTEVITLCPDEDVVWLSHGDVDLTLRVQAIAEYGGYDAVVGEPDVAPLQVQGPRSPDVVATVAGAEVSELAPFRNRHTRVAGTDVVVSHTGWSGDIGFELYPIGSDRALDIWRAILAAGEPFEIVVGGPNLVTACERWITDTHYYVNSGMDPFEAGIDWAIDLNAGQFIGRDALLAARDRPRARRTLGLLAKEDVPIPRMEWFWPVVDDDGPIGEARWIVRSIALSRPIAIALVDARTQVGDELRISHPDGELETTAVELPFVKTKSSPNV
jgi:glycine cleavage system aminomethyltransferase T